MAEAVLEIGVIIARRPFKSRSAKLWGAQAWSPVAALPAAPDLPLGAALAREGDQETLFAGAHVLSLYASETAHYRDNLRSGRPHIWIWLGAEGDRPEVLGVTADPYEGEAMAEGIGRIVEAVPMPAAIQHVVAAFVATHHVERPFIKRKRDRGVAN